MNKRIELRIRALPHGWKALGDNEFVVAVSPDGKHSIEVAQRSDGRLFVRFTQTNLGTSGWRIIQILKNHDNTTTRAVIR